MRTTRPTQPMIRGRDACRRHQRGGGDDGDAPGLVATPNASAASSGSDITFMRHAARLVRDSSGVEQRQQVRQGVADRLPSSQNVMAGSWL